LRRALPEILEDAANGLSDVFRPLLERGLQQLRELDGHIAYYTGLIERQGREDEAVRRLQTIPGFGPIVASAFYSLVGDGQGYRRGRDVAAALGLVPAQHSTGGKVVLLGISKRGDRYSALPAGARRPRRDAAGRRQGRPAQHLAQSPGGDGGLQQGDGGLGEQAGAHRLGGAAPPHRLSARQGLRGGRAHGGRRGGVREPESISDQPRTTRINHLPSTSAKAM